MAKSQRFRKATSDRSGFDYKKIELINDNGVLVGPDEYDMPPPSTRSLGGEGDISGEARNNSDFSTINTIIDVPSESLNPIVYVNSTDGITPNFNHPFMRVTGSASAVDIAANPQIKSGKQGDVLTLICIDSNITLDHGNGLNLMGSSNFVMTSGSVISFIYTTGGTVWNETSRSKNY